MNKTIVYIKVEVMMDKTLKRRTMLFVHTTTMPLIKSMTMRRIYLMKIRNGNQSQMIWKFLIYQIIIMVPIGLRQAWIKHVLLFFSDFFLQVDLTWTLSEE